jgi:hypothetical protein
MALQLTKAQRSRAYLKLGISAPSGAGKTLGSILLGYGLVKEAHPDWTEEQIWEHIAIIDSENGSGQLYVGTEHHNINIGVYNVITLTPPFEAEKYIQAIDLCKEAGMEVCIIDSTTPLWSGVGGLLEQQNNAAKRGGNSYTAWRDITPMHNRFVDSMLQAPMHIIATMRAKQEYVQEKGPNDKTIIRKVGMEPEQRKGMEYEFTIFLEINNEHDAFGSKDRTSQFDQKTFKITPEVGKQMMRWLEEGTDKPVEVVKESIQKADAKQGLDAVQRQVVDLCKKLGGRENPELITLLKANTPEGSGNPNAIKDIKVLTELYIKLQDLLQQQETVEKPVEETIPA